MFHSVSRPLSSGGCVPVAENQWSFDSCHFKDICDIKLSDGPRALYQKTFQSLGDL